MNTSEGLSQIIDRLLDIPFVIFSLQNEGPVVIFSRNTENLLLDDDHEIFLTMLGVKLSIITDWNFGVFELPVPIPESDSKMLVINFSVASPSASDPRLRENTQLQACLFIPKDIMRKLPSCSVYEDALLFVISQNFQDDESIIHGNQEFRKILFMTVINMIK
ncbi:MAG: hypothetical protein INQ03_22530 [Candidatus Heimdallarchaeota archaeon]|nr:hypothetical protein [Candidatus Heimdallarchaeota archaeon]